MRNRKDRTRRDHGRRKLQAARIVPFAEVLESRLVMSGTGFLQGTVFLNSSDNQVSYPTNAYPNPFSPSTPGIVIPGATIELFQGTTATGPYYAKTTSATDGSYSFSNLNPGTYTILEIPPAGYANQTTTYQSPLNPVTASTSNTITVQVVDPTSLTVSFDSGDYNNPSTTTGEYARYPGGINFTYTSNTETDSESFSFGQLPITVTGTGLSTTQEFSAFCVNVLEGLGFSPDSFSAVASPSTTSINNGGEIGYLYDQYINYLVDQFGNPLSNTQSAATEPFTQEQGYEAQALQLAIWKLEYTPGPASPISTNPSDPSFQSYWNSGNLSNFSLVDFEGTANDPQGMTDTEVRATQYINDALEQSEQAIFLLGATSPQGNQDLIAPGSLNFNNLATPSITTSQQPASATVGSSIADQATVSGGDNPTGTVTFALYNNPNASGTPLYTDANVPLVGGVATSAGYTATATGTDYWVATYNGDSNNGPVTSGTALEPVSVTPATPAISTTQQPASATVGSSIADKATVTGGDSPTGTVTFNLYNNSGGTGTPLFTDTETLSGGTATSKGYTATATGTDYWVATYNGDSNNSSVTSGTSLEPVSITPATPAISTTQQPASATVGSSIADKATVTGGDSPTGTVTFNLYNNSGGTGTPLFTDTEALSGGTATSKGYTATAAGTDYWVATYNGNSNNSPVTSGTALEPVVISSTTITLSTTPGGAVPVSPITISGTKYLDATGGGFSTDDTPQSGVTIDLLQPTSGGNSTVVASTTTDSNGNYSFSVNTPGIYYVQEVVPNGYIQTGGGPNGNAGNTYYTINAQSGESYSGYNFDDFLIPSCTTCGSSNFTYQVTNPTGGWRNTPVTTTVSDLSGNTAQGDTVTITLPKGSTSTYTLVVYTSPTPYFSDANAYQQKIYASSTGSYATATNHQLSVTIPNTYYQLDFVCGQAINQLEPNQNNDAYGPDASEILYHAENRFIDGDNSGCTAPPSSSLSSLSPNVPTPTTAPSTTGQALSDSATLTGGYNPTGTITFYLFAPGVTPSSATSPNNAVYSDAIIVTGGTTTYSTGTGTIAGSAVPSTTGTYQWVVIYSGDGNNKSVTSGIGSEPESVYTPSSITGTVYCDMNVNDSLDSCDQGVSNVTVELLSGNNIVQTTTTNSNGVYTFTGLAPSTGSGYTVEVLTPTGSGDFSETANVGTVNGKTLGTGSASPEQVTGIVLNGTTQSTGINYNFPLLEPASISGQVIDDGLQDCQQDSCDQGLEQVTVTLTGTTYAKASVTMMTTTGMCGDYTFANLAPGTYTVTVSPPSGFSADADWVGTDNGNSDGKASSKSTICNIALGGCGDEAINYVFSLVGSASCSSQTQGCSYWCGSQGQQLINNCNGNSSCTQLGNWLASVCPNLFGKLEGCTNSQIASYCKQWSTSNSNQQACAQVLSTALCAYVTNSNLCGNTGASYGFSVSGNGLGASTYNVGQYGQSIGLSNSQTCSIDAILSQIDGNCSNGSISNYCVSSVNKLCSNINNS